MPADQIPPEHSRALRLAGRATGTSSGLLEHLQRTTTVVSAQPELPGAVQTLAVLLTTLRRLPGRLQLDPAGLDRAVVDQLVAAVAAVDPTQPLFVDTACGNVLHLHVGVERRGNALRAVPHRHGAHLLADPAVAVDMPADASGLGAVYAATMAAAEAFAICAQVRADRYRRAAHRVFCPVTLTNDPNAAPPLTTPIEIDLALLGIGAIGTAVVLILELLPLHGRLLVVDRQRYALENLGTYTLGTRADADANLWKTELAANALTHWDVTRLDIDLDDLPATLETSNGPWPRIAIAAVDSVPARHAAQRLWPDHLIDAATGDTTLGMHDLAPDGPCEMCIYPTATNGPAAVDRLAAATGLTAHYLAVDAPLDAETVDALPADRRDRLRPLVGTPRCGLARALGLTDLQADDYQPAVPFVSQGAACLAVGRLIAHLTATPTHVTEIQYDALLGVEHRHLDTPRPRPDCYCQQNRGRIAAVRQHHQERT